MRWGFGRWGSEMLVYKLCGLLRKTYDKMNVDYVILEQEMQVLKDCFIYSHTKRGEGHFLFYVQTNYLMVKQHDEIVVWLQSVKKVLSIDAEVYNAIVEQLKSVYREKEFKKKGYYISLFK